MLCFLFHFLFYLLGPLSFLLGESGQRFVNFVYPFIEPPLSFTNFFPIFYSLIYFFSDLYYVLPSADFWSFKILLGGMLGCLFENFLCSWRKSVLLWTFFYELLLWHPIDFCMAVFIVTCIKILLNFLFDFTIYPLIVL